jgi:MATE family multidrug resistance protein
MALIKQIFRLAIPSIATFSSMTFMGLLTLMIVGKLGAAALAVVGIANMLMYNIWALFSGIQGAINYLVAQNYGSGTMRVGNQRMQIALMASLGISILVFFSSFEFPHMILKWMGANETILTLGTTYLQVRMIAFVLTIFNIAFFAYMRAIGDTSTPMIISLLVDFSVVAFTYVFCYGQFGFPKLGLQGAAWSMVAAEGVAFLLNLLVYYGVLNKSHMTRKWVPIDWSEVRLLMSESIKLSIAELSNSLGMLVFTSCITRLGTAAIAANEIALNILSFGYMPSNGFGAASTIGIGQEIGKGQPQEAKRFGLVTAYLGMGFMILVSIALFLFALPITKLYTTDYEVYSRTLSLIYIVAFMQLFSGATVIFGGGLRGVGDTTFLSRASLVFNWILFIPGTLLLTQVYDLGQVGAWAALCSMNVITGVANYWRYHKFKWSSAKSKTINIHIPARTDV